MTRHWRLSESQMAQLDGLATLSESTEGETRPSWREARKRVLWDGEMGSFRREKKEGRDERREGKERDER